MLKVENVGKVIEGRNVVSGISFLQNEGEKLVIAGETGAGKSSLMKMVSGLLQVDTGVVLMDGERIKGPDETLVPGHPEIAYLSQFFELPKFLRVEQVLDYANQLSSRKAGSIFEMCGVDTLLQRGTDQLSGGEKQRVALAKLLISVPRLLILDEPFSNLDLQQKIILKEVIERISKQLEMTIMLSSHDPEDTLPWADRIIVLKDGALVQQGSPRQIYEQPVNEYVAGLFGTYNTIASDSKLWPSEDIKTASTQLILRPEDILLDESKGLEGVVQDVKYFGPHYYAYVSISQQVLVVNVPGPLKIGHKIRLRIKSDS